MKELIQQAVGDLSLNGKFQTLYQTLLQEIEDQIDDKEMDSITKTLMHVGINPISMSKPEILFAYSKLP